MINLHVFSTRGSLCVEKIEIILQYTEYLCRCIKRRYMVKYKERLTESRFG